MATAGFLSRKFVLARPAPSRPARTENEVNPRPQRSEGDSPMGARFRALAYRQKQYGAKRAEEAEQARSGAMLGRLGAQVKFSKRKCKLAAISPTPIASMSAHRMLRCRASCPKKASASAWRY